MQKAASLYDVRDARAPGHGFTLVELLVVIGIIVLLISILLPALNRARDAANTIRCLSSLRQLGNDCLFYAADNRNYVPIAKYVDDSVTPNVSFTWEELLLPYLDAKFKKPGVALNMNNLTNRARDYLWACPTFMATWTGEKESPTDDLSHRCGYGMNILPKAPSYFGFPGAVGSADHPADLNWYQPSINRYGRWQKLTDWSRPAERAMIGDEEGPPQMYVNPPSASGAGSDTIATRHSRGRYANMVFWDGSGRSLTRAEARLSVRFKVP